MLTNAVAKLRKALGADGARVVTVPRQGYRIGGPIERIAVATRLTSRLELRVGKPVPGRPNFLPDSGASTPLYIAPELVEGGGSPTVQSDLFALGLILYQIAIANLRKPMASGWEHEIDDELLVADIKAATDGDPARRLESVAALTQRLRQLEVRREARDAQRTASARAAAAERALERARIRRPWMVAAACALVLGLVISLVLYRNERLARSEAERAAIRAELAARQAEAVNRFVADDLLGAADLSRPGGAHNPSMREILGRAADTLNTRFGDQPVSRHSKVWDAMIWQSS